MINEIFYVLNSRCSQCCKGCYLASQKQYPDRDYKKAVSDLQSLSQKSKAIFLTGSDVLSYDNVERLFQYSNQTILLGNFVSIPNKRKVLETISKNSNVRFVMITSPNSANVKKDDALQTKEAVRSIKESGLEPVLTFVIGSHNFNNIESFANEAIDTGVKYTRFIRFIPLDEEYKSDFLDDSLMGQFLSKIKMLREKIPRERLYIRVDGLFGTEWRKEKGKTCSAGTNDLLIGLDNRIYPCEFLAREEFILGSFENGVINLERVLTGLSDYDCKAKQIFGDGKKPEFVKVNKRI
jgi:MoaA/NifB/PqqE/SkfB family radical SAM enzyme